MAVSAATALLGNCLEESQFVSQPPRRKKLQLEGAGGLSLHGLALSDDEEAQGGGWSGYGWLGAARVTKKRGWRVGWCEAEGAGLGAVGVR